MIKFKHTGDFSKTYKFLRKDRVTEIRKILTRYGEYGVIALSEATPKDTGKTSQSWHYRIEGSRDKYTLYWYNDNDNHGVSIVYLLVYGHATRGGTYIEGYDFVTPAIKPILESIANDSWKEVTSE